LGDLVLKNKALKPNAVEKLTAANHHNGKDFWIITFNQTLVNYISYLLTEKGIDAYIGFTSGTGCAIENHDILSWETCLFGRTTGIENNNNNIINDDNNIYPISANDFIMVNSSENHDLIIYNCLGEEVLRIPSLYRQSLKIDINSFSTGVYLVWMCNGIKIFLKE